VKILFCLENDTSGGFVKSLIKPGKHLGHILILGIQVFEMVENINQGEEQ
jgi:hypothetical protein